MGIAVATDMVPGANGRQRDEPQVELIRELAYRLYVQRGSINGRDFDDWIEAEAVLNTVFTSLRELNGELTKELDRYDRLTLDDVLSYLERIADTDIGERRYQNEWQALRALQRMGKKVMPKIEHRTGTDETATGLPGYQDPFKDMSKVELKKLKGKFVAVSALTGEIIAVADTAEQLRDLVKASEIHGDKPWKRMSVTDGKEMTLDDFDFGSSCK